MIITEHCEIDGREFVHTRSDANRYIVSNGEVFEDVYDLVGYEREYEEGNYIPPREDEPNEAAMMLGIIVNGE